jgi:hypothetical protein
MATTLIGWRPSALPAVHPMTGSAFLDSSREGVEAVLPLAAVCVPARSAVPPYGKTPMTVTAAGSMPAMKINNYIGAPAALGLAAAGATTSALIDLATGDLRIAQRGADKVKGSDARGIPPRGKQPA